MNAGLSRFCSSLVLAQTAFGTGSARGGCTSRCRPSPRCQKTSLRLDLACSRVAPAHSDEHHASIGKHTYDVWQMFAIKKRFPITPMIQDGQTPETFTLNPNRFPNLRPLVLNMIFIRRTIRCAHLRKYTRLYMFATTPSWTAHKSAYGHRENLSQPIQTDRHPCRQ